MRFTLNDFADAIQQIEKLGETTGVFHTAMPVDASTEVDHNQELRCLLAIIRSMTKDEREYPEQIHQNRSRRIAQGSGTDPKDVDDLVQQFLQVRQFMEKMASNRARETDKPQAWSTIPFERKIWPLK